MKSINKRVTNKKFQKGFGILEIMIVLSIAGVIAVGVMTLVPKVMANMKTNDLSRDIAFIAQAINSSAATTGTFGTNSLNSYLIASDKLPKNIINTTGTVLSHAFQGEIETGGLSQRFFIRATNLDRSVCIALFTNGSGAKRISIGSAPTSASILTAGFDSNNLTQANAVSSCASETGNTINFHYY